MTTALITYGTNVAASTLSTASKLATATGGTNATVDNSLGITPSGYGQLYSQGNASAWPNLGSIGSPDGHGWFLEAISLTGQQILAGNWTPTFRIKISGTGTPTVTADLYERAYIYNGGVYTLIGSMLLSAQSLTTTTTNYTFGATSLGLTKFGTSDSLYLDAWMNITNVSGTPITNSFRCFLVNIVS